jgi:hypothetical protein
MPPDVSLVSSASNPLLHAAAPPSGSTTDLMALAHDTGMQFLSQDIHASALPLPENQTQLVGLLLLVGLRLASKHIDHVPRVGPALEQRASNLLQDVRTGAGHQLPFIHMLGERTFLRVPNNRFETSRINADNLKPAPAPARGFLTMRTLVFGGMRTDQEQLFLDIVRSATGQSFDSIQAFHDGLQERQIEGGGSYRCLGEPDQAPSFVEIRGSEHRSTQFNPEGYCFRLTNGHFIRVRPTEDGLKLAVRYFKRSPVNAKMNPKAMMELGRVGQRALLGDTNKRLRDGLYLNLSRPSGPQPGGAAQPG